MKKKYIIILRSSGPKINIFLERHIKLLNYFVKTYPILDMLPLRKRKILTNNAQAVCTSSINGIFLLSKLTEDRKIKLFTMGNSSKRIAQDLGFKNIIDCSGDSDRMLELIFENTVKGQGEIIYAGANTISVDFPQILASYGYNVKRYILYKTFNTKCLQDDLIKIVSKNNLEWIVLLSKKGARNCFRLLSKKFSLSKINSIKFLCLSPNVANSLSKKVVNKFYPNKPNIDELIKIIIRENKNGC